MHNCRLLLGLDINSTGKDTREELGQINPFYKFSSSYSFRVVSCTLNIGYSSLYSSI
jgi:hypothetical protein